MSSPQSEGLGSIEIAPEDRVLGRYHLRSLIAQGGMASVHLAQLASEGGFQRWVALKLVHPHLARNARFVRMLLDEARITARIQHPNVCSVIDFGREDETCYLVMEYLHGESLATITRTAWQRDGFPWELACRIIADAAKGLHAAHELRDEHQAPLHVVHRDVSPQNLIVLYDGVTKVLDFGVARARGKLEKTESGEVKGKLAYMAPEQLLGGAYDRRIDVWALAVVLWEMLAGKRLFRGENDGESVQRVLQAEIPSLCELRPDLPPAVDAVIAEALLREPRARTSTIGELGRGLEEALHAAGARAGTMEVSAWLRDLLAERRAMRDEMLRARASNAPPPGPDRSLGGEETTTEAGRERSVARRRRASLTLATTMIVSIAVGAAATLAIGSADRDDDRPRSGAAPAAEPPSGVAPRAPETTLAAEPPATVVTAPAEIAPDHVEIDPPASTRARRERGTGTLNLMAIPPARVYERGRLLGETPLMGRSLPAGPHRLELRPIGGGPPRQVRVVIRAGELTRESVR